MLLTDQQIIPHLHRPVTGIIHVGAHQQEEAGFYARHFHHACVCWIDALVPKTRNRLWVINSFKGTCNFWKASNVASSSILKPKLHLEKHPNVTFEKPQTVNCTTLKHVIPDTHVPNYNMICLDIQGAELRALTGYQEQLQHVDYIYTEVNTEELYEKCALLPDMDRFMSRHGFTRKELQIVPGKGWGDAFYVKGDRF